MIGRPCLLGALWLGALWLGGAAGLAVAADPGHGHNALGHNALGDQVFGHNALGHGADGHGADGHGGAAAPDHEDRLAHDAEPHDAAENDAAETGSRTGTRTGSRTGTRVAQASDIVVPQATLRAESGEQVDLLADVLGDSIVLIDFIYTTCTTICPVSTAILSRVREDLGARMGEEVLHVSISTDPVTDTPARLSDYAEPFEPLDGWRLLTGEKPVVDDVLLAFDAYTADFRDHPQMIVVGDARSGRFFRIFGIPDPDIVIDLVDRLAAERETHS